MMPKIRVKLEVDKEYCDRGDHTCPFYRDNTIASFCVLFRHELEEDTENCYYCKRLSVCKQAEVEE